MKKKKSRYSRFLRNLILYLHTRLRDFRRINSFSENVALQAPVFDMSVLLLVEHIVALQTLVLRKSVLLLVEHIVYRYL